jgi:hypothetical protein
MEALKFDSNGLLTAVAQDINTGQVLMADGRNDGCPGGGVDGQNKAGAFLVSEPEETVAEG